MRTIRLGRRGSGLFLGTVAALAVGSFATSSHAQTWSETRTTPSGLELVAVDATGELFWPYGVEDVAGDGDTFEQPERGINLRTAYATTDAQRIWARIYVADQAAPPTNVIGFVFVDSDSTATTGGTAAATDIHPGLAADPSGGGYEAVLVLRGSGVAPEVWTWNDGPDRWEQQNPEAAQVAAENGVDRDPIGGGLGSDDHGYLQGNAEHALLDVAATCAARIFVRSVVDAPEGGGDANLGVVSPCVPVDANADGVPDNAVPPSCDADDDCPFDGICVDGTCRQTELCDDAADCDPDEDCSLDGRCVARPGDTCSDDTTCSSQLCANGTCATCTPGGSECGAGRRCGPDGRCVAGDDPGAGVGTGAGTGAGGGGDGLGGDVQGGACACDLAGHDRGASGAWAIVVAAIASGIARRRARQTRTERTAHARRSEVSS